MTRQEKIEELIGLFLHGAITISGLIDECLEFGQHPHWTSVEDELPEENKWVLTYNGSSINLLMLAGNGNWYDHSVAQHRNITHWMALPTPPAKLSSVERNVKKWKE